jgi:hypothetical protein
MINMEARQAMPTEPSKDMPNAAITWPQVVLGEEDNHVEAAQVNGGVRDWQECPVQKEVTSSKPPSTLHLRKSAR